MNDDLFVISLSIYTRKYYKFPDSYTSCYKKQNTSSFIQRNYQNIPNTCTVFWSKRTQNILPYSMVFKNVSYKRLRCNYLCLIVICLQMYIYIYFFDCFVTCKKTKQNKTNNMCTQQL